MVNIFLDTTCYFCYNSCMKYKETIELLRKVYETLPEGVNLTKGGIGELALAHHLGHTLVDGDKGADAEDDDGKLYEYKVSATNQFNFNFQNRYTNSSKWEDRIENYMNKLEGAYVALHEGIDIVEVAYCDAQVLKKYLLNHFANTTGAQLNKNFRMKAFKELNNV